MKNLDYAIVFVSDMDRSVAFYRDALGLTLKFESSHWTEFATGAATVALHLADSVNPEGSTRGQNEAGRCRLGFGVDDLDSFHRKMEAALVECVQPPRVEEFGGKIAVYADPDGCRISVAERPR